MVKKFGPRLLLAIAIAATIGCDRVTKHVAATTLAGAPGRSFLADTIRLEYAENTGAFLGLGAEWPAAVRTAIFGVGTAILLVGLTTMAIRLRWAGAARAGVALFAAGGASNLLDRVAHGSVIDFMNVGLGPLRTGIFNVADMAIMLGAGVVLIEGWRADRRADGMS